jgi:hypothetical protein
VHDRGRVLADLACAIADGARAISDFRVMGDQAELFGLVASVPTAWRTLRDRELGKRADRWITAAGRGLRRHSGRSGQQAPLRRNSLADLGGRLVHGCRSVGGSGWLSPSPRAALARISRGSPAIACRTRPGGRRLRVEALQRFPARGVPARSPTPRLARCLATCPAD